MNATDLDRLKKEIKDEVLRDIRAELFPSSNMDELVKAIKGRDKKFLKKYNEEVLKGK